MSTGAGAPPPLEPPAGGTPASSGTAATPQASPPGNSQPATASGGTADNLQVIAGLIAVCAGLVALVIVVIVALIVKPDTTGGSIATSATAVIGSIVGAYFGVKVGSEGTQKAVQAQQDEATKAQVFALHATPSDPSAVLNDAKALIAAQRRPPSK